MHVTLLLLLAATPARTVPAAPLPLAHELVEASGLAEESFAAWLGDLKSQYEGQRASLNPVPPDRFWEQVLVTFDLNSQRAQLDAAVAGALGSPDIYDSLEWLRQPVVASLPERRARMRSQLEGARRGWEDASARLAADAVEGRTDADENPAPARPALSDVLPAKDVEDIHRLMAAMGVGSPEALTSAWLASAREAFPEAPDELWAGARARHEVADAVRGVEHAFSRTWSPAEARALLAALSSEGATRHRARMASLDEVLAAAGDRFIADFEAHFAARFAAHALERSTAR